MLQRGGNFDAQTMRPCPVRSWVRRCPISYSRSNVRYDRQRYGRDKWLTYRAADKTANAL